MAQFSYIARNASGSKTTGILEAATEAAAIRQLDEQRLFPIRVSEKQDSNAGSRTGSVKSREMAIIFEQLADLLKAGVPMMRALHTLSRSQPNKTLNVVLTDIANKVSEGRSLSEAMAEQGKVFNTLHMAMIKAGERGGFLEDVLMDLAGYLERQDELVSKVRGAMIYPVLLAGLGVGAIFICLIWLVPKFKPLFEGVTLPLPSRLLFGSSDIVLEQWPITAAITILVVIGGVMFFTTETGKKLWTRGQLRIPVLGKTLLMVSLTRFCRILGTMLASGVPILQALQISRDATGTPQLAEAIEEATESVREGQGLTVPLRRSNLMPDQILEMMAVAEESNQLEKVLLKVADTVERRTNQQVDQAVRLLEPVILVILALAILFIALGVLFPIFNMAQSIR